VYSRITKKKINSHQRLSFNQLYDIYTRLIIIVNNRKEVLSGGRSCER
jgi:hypothetical protein